VAVPGISTQPFGKLSDVTKKFPPYIPAVVAAANGLVVAATIFSNQSGNYPGRLLAVQGAIVVAALILSARNQWIRGIGFSLLFVFIVLSFSAMFLYIPTLVAALWLLISKRGLEPQY
jgi:hypothetical protein